MKAIKLKDSDILVVRLPQDVPAKTIQDVIDTFSKLKKVTDAHVLLIPESVKITVLQNKR